MNGAEEMSGDVEMKLTPKQEKFVDFFIETGNASEAARRAGYSRGSIEDASDWLNPQKSPKYKPYLDEAIKLRQAEIKSKRTATITEVMEFLTSVMRGEITEEVVVVEGQGEGVSEARLVEKSASVADRIKAADHILKRFGRPPTLEEKEMQLRVDKLRAEVEAAMVAQDGKDGNADVVIMLPEKEAVEGSREE